MSKPKVFISSTYFDLKHIRSSLENFISSLGYDVILSEKGNIAFSPDLALDESCYKEAQASDIFVLIIGERYGTEATPKTLKNDKNFINRYVSITKKEYLSAREKGIPIYILVEKPVYAEYETYLRNKGNENINYAHVESINTFELIDYIILQPSNNPIFQFDKLIEIESWLRDQWAGLFRDLLQRIQSQIQIADLQSQVSQLSEINKTLKHYLEKLVASIVPTESKKIIETEEKRLNDARIDREISENFLADFFIRKDQLPISRIRECITQASSVSQFIKLLNITPNNNHDIGDFEKDPDIQRKLVKDFNELRDILNLSPLKTETIQLDDKSNTRK